MARRAARNHPPSLDPTGELHSGLPTYPWGASPLGLMTRRQLAAAGLRKAGQAPVAQIVRGRHLHAYLYDITKAAPRRTWTKAWHEATFKAAAARRVCGTCGVDRGYIPSQRLGECNECADARTLARV